MSASVKSDNNEEIKLPQYKVENRVNIQFKNLSFSPKPRFFSKRKVTILKNVNGEFKAGEFSALLGTSGAGKSTLLNILTGFISVGVGGEIFDNGELRDPDEFGKKCSYIMQDDKLYPLLTVQEAMNFAADLKLPSHLSSEEKKKRTEGILKSLGLYDCRNTLTATISGGQRRRLSIGIELVHNPPVLFLDEPTSGLDDVTAKQIITLLSKLSKEGRTVVCTIHQPSATVLEMFDHVYCLVDGRCTYQGTASELRPYLEGFDPPLICPNYHNPADFLLDVCCGDYGDVYDSMVHRCANGEVSVKGCDNFEKNDRSENSNFAKNNKNELPSIELLNIHEIYATTFLHQVIAIIKRTYVMLSRDKQLTFTRMFLHVITALLTGILYFQIGEDGRFTLDNFNFIFFTFLFLMYVSFCSMLIAFSNELPIITREHFNRWYSVKSYLIGTTIADLPIQLTATFVYILLSYFMTGQPMVWYRFGIFVLMCFLNSLVAQSIGMLFSAFMKLETSVVIGPVALCPFIVFSGYFIHMRDAPYFTHWAFHCSFLRYGLEGAVQAIMGFGRGKLACPGEYCHFVYPEVFMNQIGMVEPRILLDVCVLLLYYVVLKIASYLALSNCIGGKK